jgi:hypothetical protein
VIRYYACLRAQSAPVFGAVMMNPTSFM